MNCDSPFPLNNMGRESRERRMPARPSLSVGQSVPLYRMEDAALLSLEAHPVNATLPFR